jgi:hypothetical protein
MRQKPEVNEIEKMRQERKQMSKSTNLQKVSVKVA